jgi:hypothetical protein
MNSRVLSISKTSLTSLPVLESIKSVQPKLRGTNDERISECDAPNSCKRP